MAKKLDELEIDEVVEESGISELDMNLYRDDLNALVAKVNELVRAVNKS